MYSDTDIALDEIRASRDMDELDALEEIRRTRLQHDDPESIMGRDPDDPAPEPALPFLP